ncbi:Anaerobic regulatory protein [wastewater metagenome]|uniref:Anaerobic regulatory protein n=2 Tax=unclassified sequences TaxID=12908 RepID=A0A5B8RGX3_9ZZZZ|nr:MULTISPECIES: helix-turn-helix domain-containing protein [Arhodomonas]MCS4503781.1 helix-turn-helix domain-containing protein [Arhodomonas aquaeolei]QEA06754.1 anaerobic regulatory protein [uncultured organism]
MSTDAPSQALDRGDTIPVLQGCTDCDLYRVCFPEGLRNPVGEPDTPMVHQRVTLPARQALRWRPGRCLGVLRSGAVKRSRYTATGEEVIAGFTLPGEPIGLDAGERMAPDERLVTLERSRVCELPWETVEEAMAADPRVRQAVNRLLREELSTARERLLGACRGSARQRVAGFLLDMAERRCRRGFDGMRLRLAMGRREIAAYLNITLETVSRTVSQLGREGIIGVDGRRITLRNALSLAYIADGVEMPA